MNLYNLVVTPSRLKPPVENEACRVTSPGGRMTEAVEPPKPINLLKSDYKLVGKLGSGGFSFVYSVESVDTGIMCAAKFQVHFCCFVG